jgi:hypothetical protein
MMVVMRQGLISARAIRWNAKATHSQTSHWHAKQDSASELQAGNEGVKAADHASPKQHWARNAGPSMHRGLDLTKAATAIALLPIIGCRI